MHAELAPGVSLCTHYTVFDVTRPPFDDLKVRQAFSLAVDRSQLIDVVYDGAALIATGLYPPGLPGRREGQAGQTFDPQAAKSKLAESRYAGSNFPAVMLTEAGYGSYVDADAAALASMWRRHLGITIRVENLDPVSYWDEIKAGNRGQIWTTGWCADYPDPENFADVLFHTGADFNEGGYSNPALDSLLESARTETDVAKRMEMYQQAEDIIVADVPVLFTAHALSYVLIKPYIQGYVNTPIDIPIERYLSIDTSLLP
jgi:oligopeptide transport system substrate-binding protein